jgi:hypothetical protein
VARWRRDFDGWQGTYKILEERVDRAAPAKAGREYSPGEGKTKLAVYSTLKRGCLLGSQKFKESLVRILEKQASGRRKVGGVAAAAAEDHGKWRARRIVKAGLAVFDTTMPELRRAAKSDCRKGLMPEMIQCQTTMKLDWISAELRTGDRSSCSRIIRTLRENLPQQRERTEKQKVIEKMSMNHA